MKNTHFKMWHASYTHRYFVDFYCKDLMLAIEVDGVSHDFENVAINDEKRQTQLENMGVRFLRFGDHR